MNSVSAALVLVAWMACLASLAPAVWRLVCHRGRHLDPIWALLFVGVINRVLLPELPAAVANTTALLIAGALATFATWYQRHDA